MAEHRGTLLESSRRETLLSASIDVTRSERPDNSINRPLRFLVMGHRQTGKSTFIQTFKNGEDFPVTRNFAERNYRIILEEFDRGNAEIEDLSAADGYIFLYSAVSVESFNKAHAYHREVLERKLRINFPKILVENQIEDEDFELNLQGLQEAEFISAKFCPCSVFDPDEVENAIQELVLQVRQKELRLRKVFFCIPSDKFTEENYGWFNIFVKFFCHLTLISGLMQITLGGWARLKAKDVFLTTWLSVSLLLLGLLTFISSIVGYYGAKYGHAIYLRVYISTIITLVVAKVVILLLIELGLDTYTNDKLLASPKGMGVYLGATIAVEVISVIGVIVERKVATVVIKNKPFRDHELVTTNLNAPRSRFLSSHSFKALPDP